MKTFIISLCLLLAACSTSDDLHKKIELDADKAQPLYQLSKRKNELLNFAPIAGPKIPIAIYKFGDLTGQRKPNTNFADLSTAVTQGSEVFLIKSLQDVGKGTWFTPVERVDLDNLVKERQLIRSQRELYEGKEAKPLTPLVVAGIMVEGGIVGYDSNLLSGGIGARMLGIGLSQQYRKDEVTVVLRLISINTGEIMLTAGATKTIFSTGVNGNLLEFVDAGTTAVEFEAGSNVNEPTTYAIRIAIDEAVVAMVKDGMSRGFWKFKKEDKR